MKSHNIPVESGPVHVGSVYCFNTVGVISTRTVAELLADDSDD